jgi:hypothetical protein
MSCSETMAGHLHLAIGVVRFVAAVQFPLGLAQSPSLNSARPSIAANSRALWRTVSAEGAPKPSEC